MASYLPGPLERPPVSKGPNLNSLRAVFIYSGGYVLAKQLHRAHRHPERNTDSQLEEEDGPQTPTTASSGCLVPNPDVQSWTTAQEIRACKKASRTWASSFEIKISLADLKEQTQQKRWDTQFNWSPLDKQ